MEIFKTSDENCEFCQRIFRPVCGSDGITYANECEMGAENCRRGVSPVPDVVSQGPCSDGDVVVGAGDSVTRDDYCQDVRPCSKIFAPVCGYNGLANVTFTNECKLRKQSCTTRTNFEVGNLTI